jgi:hypothetical protein
MFGRFGGARFEHAQDLRAILGAALGYRKVLRGGSDALVTSDFCKNAKGFHESLEALQRLPPQVRCGENEFSIHLLPS